MMRYTVVVTPEPDGSEFNVTVPALPGCFTWGASVEEAVAHARDAIAVTSPRWSKRGSRFPSRERPMPRPLTPSRSRWTRHDLGRHPAAEADRGVAFLVPR